MVIWGPSVEADQVGCVQVLLMLRSGPNVMTRLLPSSSTRAAKAQPLVFGIGIIHITTDIVFPFRTPGLGGPVR